MDEYLKDQLNGLLDDYDSSNEDSVKSELTDDLARFLDVSRDVIQNGGAAGDSKQALDVLLAIERNIDAIVDYQLDDKRDFIPFLSVAIGGPQTSAHRFHDDLQETLQHLLECPDCDAVDGCPLRHIMAHRLVTQFGSLIPAISLQAFTLGLAYGKGDGGSNAI